MSTTGTVPKTTLGRTGIKVSKLTLGTWGFGDASAPAARIGSDENLVDTLNAAFALGISTLDAADGYANEERLGALLKQTNAPDDLVISTKFGGRKGFKADDIVAAVESSLKHLGLEKLPLMLIHDPRSADDMAIVLGKGGALEGLRKLQSQGLVGGIGVATGTMTPLWQTVNSGEFDCIQFPRHYTLLLHEVKANGLLAAARAKGMGTLLPAPYAGNILATGTSVEKPLYGYWTPQPEVVEAVKKMEVRCAELGVGIAEAAIAFAATEPLIDTIIVGATKPEEIRQTCAYANSKLTRAEVESIADAGKVDPYFLGGPEFVMPFPPDKIPPELAARMAAAQQQPPK
jgi:D-threo-aldose 1-dehydrogenase